MVRRHRALIRRQHLPLRASGFAGEPVSALRMTGFLGAGECLVVAAHPAGWAPTPGGLGWAGDEGLYALITGFLTHSRVQRTDAEAVQARQMLEAQGLLRETGPMLGIVERIGATALHIGFTLLIAWRPVVVIATVLIHSAVNLSLIRLVQRSAILTELLLLAFGLATLLAGVAAVR